MFQTKRTKWRKLENAAKIFPATSNKKDERVFRISCELKETVEKDILQKALDKTMESFSLFSCVLRKGLFWNYLEESDIKPCVSQEHKIPCSKMYDPDHKSLLFEVTYFQKRINLEAFHALTDGTGLSKFIKVLVYHYLMLRYPDNVKGAITDLDFDMTDTDKGEDGFDKYYEKTVSKGKIPKYKAYQFKASKIEYGELKLIQGIVDTNAIVTLAKSYHTTVTVFLTALFLRAIASDMSPREKRKPVALMIPVNLRNFFPSESVRNFFGWIDLGYHFKNQSDDLDALVPYVHQFFQREITKERMAIRMNGLVEIEKNFAMRVVPLEIKILFLQLGVYLSSSCDTAIFSNIGKFRMPQNCKSYIDHFEFYTGTPKVELCSCSYEDKMTLSFTTGFENTNLFRNFFRELTELGVEVMLTVREPA